MAYSFNGSNQYLSLNSALLQENSPITISVWSYVTTLDTLRALFCIGQGSPTVGHREAILISVANRFQFLQRGIIGGVTSQAIAQTPTNTVATNVWQHIAGTSSSLSDRSIYENGVLSATNTTTITSFNTFTRTDIGANNTGGGFTWYYDGSLAEIGVWNVVLTQDEIYSLSQGFPCNKIRPQSLVFYTPLIRNLRDLKANNAITNNNSATVTSHPRIYY